LNKNKLKLDYLNDQLQLITIIIFIALYYSNLLT